jgi:putative membrane protein
MNLRNCIRTGTMAILAISFASSLASAKSGMLGQLGPDEFKQSNAAAASRVNAIQAGSTAFTENDKELAKEIALWGMWQLELSKVAASMATSQDVKMIAQAEVDEQTVVAAKLKEIAAAGRATLPASPDQDTLDMIEKLKKESALELDKKYLKESGIKGHEKLKAIMEKVQKNADSGTLKALADATLPIINTHLKVAKDEADHVDKKE